MIHFDMIVGSSSANALNSCNCPGGGTTGGGGGWAQGGVRPPFPKKKKKTLSGLHAVLTYFLHGTASKPYVDQEMHIRTLCNSR